MLICQGNNITIPRGDDGTIIINFTDSSSPPQLYMLPDGAVVVFTVKTSLYTSETLITKTLDAGGQSSVSIPINSEDTADLPYGSYHWDIRIKAAGKTDTPFPPAAFKVIEVVGNNE